MSTSSFVPGELYSREDIHNKTGGSLESYLPHVDGRAVCACLRPDLNPGAPRVILVGTGPEIRRWGKVLSSQTEPIPVFIREGPHDWRHRGSYKVVSSTRDPTALQAQAKAANREDEGTSQIIYLESTLPVDVFHRNSEDDAFLAWMDKHAGGFVLNTGRYFTSTDAVFHASGCSHISEFEGKRADYSYTGDSIKVCSTSPNALHTWLRANRPSAAKAARRCQDCSPEIDVTFSGPLYPDEVDIGSRNNSERETEGTVETVTVNRRERRPKYREACLEAWGTQCQVCGVDFADRYGEEIGEGFIHIHHLTPLSEGVQETDPVEDLRPVCPNCHAMLHQKSPPFTIDEMRTLLNKQ